MATIALFHSVLGVRPGIHAAADLLRSHGHRVRVVDQYDGRVFDDYDEAAAFAVEAGYPTLMGRALDAVKDLPEGFIAAGFSNGGGMAQFVTCRQPGVAGAVLVSGVIDLAEFGGDVTWPSGVPAQVHYAADDPFRVEEWVMAGEKAVTAAGGDLEHYEYPGTGHLFTDPSLSAEYQPDEAADLWPRVLKFIATYGKG